MESINALLDKTNTLKERSIELDDEEDDRRGKL